MQFRFRCAAVLTAVLLCSAAALPALAEETATPETADSVSTYTGWKTVNGKDYWYENGVKQGTTGRGKEIYDPDSDAWYWLDADQGGAKAVNKDVYQESNGGKWVRYDANGHMIKGWDTNDKGTYYFDLITGAMAKGDIVVDNLPCSFDTNTGIGCNLMWHSVDGKDYWYGLASARVMIPIMQPTAAKKSMIRPPVPGTGWITCSRVLKPSARMYTRNPKPATGPKTQTAPASGCGMTPTATW